MGLIAKYYLTDNETIRLIEEDYRVIYRHEEDLDLDKAWDGIHYILTGQSAFGMQAGKNPGSIAIIGKMEEAISKEPYICCINNYEINKALDLLENLTIEDFYDRCNLEGMVSNDVYLANSFLQDGKQQTIEHYLFPYFSELLKLLETAANENKSIIVCIS